MEKKSTLATLACLALVVMLTLNVNRAQAETQKAPPQRNAQSQRYEVHQTFDGQAFDKDNNIWVYTKGFADLFGMPAQFIEGIEGAEAAVFRIEDTSYQTCGFGGKEENCQKQDRCVIDLYFDESKTPLPWATDKRSEWYPRYSSVRWLRFDGRNPAYGGEIPQGVKLNKSLNGAAIIAFADPVTKQQASFTTNSGRDDRSGDESVSGPAPVLGYSRNFLGTLTLVSTHADCSVPSRKRINIRLDAKRATFDVSVAKFNSIALPEGFVLRIKEQLKVQDERNRVFYRSLFPPPLGTRGVTPSVSNPSDIK